MENSGKPRRGGGPRSTNGKKNSSRNAVKLGIRARGPVFTSEEERSQFEQLRRNLQKDLKSKGSLQVQLVNELADVIWKVEIVHAWEWQLLGAGQDVSAAALIQSFLSKSDELAGLAIPGVKEAERRSTPVWHCDQLRLRLHDGERDQPASDDLGDKLEDQRFAVEATLSDPLEKVQRYATSLVRRRDKILQLLLKLQEST